MRGAVVDTDKSDKVMENDTVFVDVVNDVVYINDTEYGSKAVATNYEIALKEEAKRVARCFQKHSSEARTNHAASHRLGYRQGVSEGQFFYVHPDIPNRGFSTRGDAAKAKLSGAYDQ